MTTKTRPRGSRPPTGRPRGRPAKENPKLDFQIMIDPAVADRLRAQTDGNLSAAIESAAEATHHISKIEVGERLEKVRERYARRAAAGVAEPRGAGRPPYGEAARKRTCVMLYPGVAEQLREYGDGNLSAGIERAALAARSLARRAAPVERPVAPTKNNHPNRNFKKHWTVDLSRQEARHTCGFLVRFKPRSPGEWNSVLVDAGTCKDNFTAATLMAQAKKVFNKARERTPS
jgi:hypothetical protein